MTREELEAKQAELNKIREGFAEEDCRNALAENRKLVGHAYVWRRSFYSCPSEESDYWDVYRLLREVVIEEDRLWPVLLYEEFYTDSRGETRLISGSEASGRVGFGGGQWEEISLEQYLLHRSNAIMELNSQYRLRKRFRD